MRQHNNRAGLMTMSAFSSKIAFQSLATAWVAQCYALQLIAVDNTTGPYASSIASSKGI